MRATEPAAIDRDHGGDARPHVPTAHRGSPARSASAPETDVAVEEVLRGLGVVAAGLRNVTVGPRAALRLLPRAGSVTLLIVRRGELQLVHDVTGPRVLTVGDVVVATGDRPVVLADGAADPAHPGPLRDLQLADVSASAVPTTEPTAEVTVATYEPVAGRRGTAFLPEVLVRPGACQPGSGVEVLDAGPPGQLPDLVVARMLDWLLPCHLAGWLEDEPGAVDGLLVTDDVVGPVLRTIHEAPQEPWTVARLAASVGVSRATLTRRFGERVGQAPMRYLAERRLALAAEHLRTTDALLETIAHRVGYADGFALSRAFSRAYGVSPSVYRASTR